MSAINEPQKYKYLPDNVLEGTQGFLNTIQFGIYKIIVVSPRKSLVIVQHIVRINTSLLFKFLSWSPGRHRHYVNKIRTQYFPDI